jgi:hypothetical protein
MPPEACGGILGYYEFLKNVTSAREDKRAHAIAWYGAPYDADGIGERQVIAALRRLGTN